MFHSGWNNDRFISSTHHWGRYPKYLCFMCLNKSHKTLKIGEKIITNSNSNCLPQVERTFSWQRANCYSWLNSHCELLEASSIPRKSVPVPCLWIMHHRHWVGAKTPRSVWALQVCWLGITNSSPCTRKSSLGKGIIFAHRVPALPSVLRPEDLHFAKKNVAKITMVVLCNMLSKKANILF